MVSEGCEVKRDSFVLGNDSIIMVGMYGVWLRLRIEVGGVEWGQIRLVLVGYVEQLGFFFKINGKVLKDCKLWSNMVIFVLNVLVRRIDQKGVGGDKSRCQEMGLEVMVLVQVRKGGNLDEEMESRDRRDFVWYFKRLFLYLMKDLISLLQWFF